MPLSNLINRPCVIVRRSASGDIDELGNETSDEARIETVCEVQQAVGRSGEPPAQGEAADTSWAAFFPPGTQLDTGDAIEVEGIGTLEVVGAPWPARNPRTQVESHVEATVRRTPGADDEDEPPEDES